MDYHRIYAEFIDDRRLKGPPLTGYTEKHHIVPRSMGGSDDAGNLIRLTASDHFFAHLLLAKIHGGAMWYAVNAMAIAGSGDRKQDRRFVLTARRWYEVAKREFGATHSKRMKGAYTGEAHPMFGKPCPPIALAKLRARQAAGIHPMQTETAREKVRAALLGREMSPEWREKIAASRRGKPLSAETRANMSKGRTGKKHSAETVAKIAAANRGKKRTPEQVAAMRTRMTGRKLSAEHRANLCAAVYVRVGMKGKQHTEEARTRYTAICAARRAYAEIHGGNKRKITLAMMRDVGIDI